MKNDKLWILAIGLIFLLGFQFPGRVQFTNAEPYLYYPCTEDINLKGKDYLIFRWRPIFPGQTREYDLKLYKGFSNIDGELLFQEKIKGPARSFKLGTEKFERGETYSWVLTQISFTGQKTEPANCSFQIK